MKNTCAKVLILVLIVASVVLPIYGCQNLNLVEYTMTLVTPPDKTEYCLGERTLNTTGMSVTIKNSLTGDEETISTFAGDDRFGVAGFDNTTVGEQTITLTFTQDDYTASVAFEIVVLDVWAEDAKTVVDVADGLSEPYANAQREYAGGADSHDNIESRLYVEIGTSATDISIVSPINAVANTTEKTMYIGYFGITTPTLITYKPYTYKNASISIAWVELMTSALPIKISAYDTIYTYSYPYTQELALRVIDGRYIAFDQEPPLKYCYVLDDNGLVSVESIKHIISPDNCWCVEIKEGRANNNNITLIVPGYAKKTVTL